MNISADILAFLKLFGKASVPGFGQFTIEKTGAQFNDQTKTLLPPSQLIIFNKNENQNDEGLIQFLAKRNQVTPDRIEKLLKDQVDSWNSTLYSGQPLLIDGLGEFDQQDFKFSGYRIESENSDFFGLEEINITDVQKSSKYKTPKGNIPKDTNKTVSVLLWIFLLVIPVLGLLYFGYTQQELIFGKKSFDDLAVKNSTHRIDTKEKIDTLKVEPKKDSLQKDSLTSPIPTTTTKKPSQNGK